MNTPRTPQAGEWNIGPGGVPGDFWIQGTPDEEGFRTVCQLSAIAYDSKTRATHARLIAAAPDLLAALVDIRTWLIAPRFSKGTLDEITALCDEAITKAKGTP